jgi:hypothetical protein
MKIFEVEIKTTRLTWESMLIRAESKDSAYKLIAKAFEMPLGEIVDDIEKDILCREYSCEGDEQVLSHG